MERYQPGCHFCPYSGLCPDGVKKNYSYTTVGPESYKKCKAFRMVKSPKKAGDVLAKMPVPNFKEWADHYQKWFMDRD